MIKQAEYRLSIDVFTPETIPMKRLAEYMGAFSEMLGVPERVHFLKVDKGSAVLLARSDDDATPKVEARLDEVRSGNMSADVLKAYELIDGLLRNDNAVGGVTYSDGASFEFPGRNRPKPLLFGPIVQPGTLSGQLVRLGGIDKTVHATLETGDGTISNIQMNREMARELGQHIYGPPVRFLGNGRWTRDRDGQWHMDRFTVSSFEVLVGSSLAEAVQGLRAVSGNAWAEQSDSDARLQEIQTGSRGDE